MANISKKEKLRLAINGYNQSQMNGNLEAYKSKELDEQNTFHRLNRKSDRRNAVADASAVPTNINTSCQKHRYNQLVERVRELEKEMGPDVRRSQVPPICSPYSAMTPCSNASGFSNYSHPQNFSPNSSAPTQRYGLSSRVLERAHQIPDRFWMDWQQKQMQNRIEELEYIKNNLTSPNNVDLPTTNHQNSTLSLYHTQHRMCIPQSTTLDRIVSTSIDNDTSSLSTDDLSSFSFDQRSIDSTDTGNLDILSPIEPMTPFTPIQKSQSTLDRSRLEIFLPFSHRNMPIQSMPTNYHRQSVINPSDITDRLVQTISSASSIEDVAQIETELNLTVLLRKNQEQTNPLLYSKAIMNRTIEFRSSSKKRSTNISK